MKISFFKFISLLLALGLISSCSNTSLNTLSLTPVSYVVGSYYESAKEKIERTEDDNTIKTFVGPKAKLMGYKDNNNNIIIPTHHTQTKKFNKFGIADVV